MDIVVHPGEETLVFGHIVDQRRIEQYLVERRVVRVEAEFLFRSDKYGCTGYFGSRARKGGDGHVEYSRHFDQIPALVVGRGTGVGHHQGYGFGNVHRSATTDADHARYFAEFVLEVVAQFIHLPSGRFVGIDVHEDDLVAALERKTGGEFRFSVEEIVDEEDKRCVTLAVGFEQFAYLVQAAAAEAHTRYLGKVSEFHGFIVFMFCLFSFFV